jgi:outer membrane protein
MRIMLAGLAVVPFAAEAIDAKIGVVDAQRLIESLPQTEAATAQLRKEFKDRQERLIAGQKDLKRLEDQLAKNGAVMSEAERGKLERDVLTKRRDLKREQDEVQDDITFRKNEEFGKIQRVAKEAIDAVAKQEGFDLILYGGVAFVSEKMDVTAKVLERLKATLPAMKPEAKPEAPIKGEGKK